MVFYNVLKCYYLYNIFHVLKKDVTKWDYNFFVIVLAGGNVSQKLLRENKSKKLENFNNIG